MIVRLNSGTSPGEPKFMTLDEFEKQYCSRHVSDTYICIRPEARHWANVARIGSRYQLSQNMFIKVKDEDDDPFNYYAPPEEKIVAGSVSWGGGGGCHSGGGGGSCSSGGGCSSGGCSGGGCSP